MRENLNFGEALEALKEGKRVARLGWNGKGMFIFQRPEITIEESLVPLINTMPASVRDFLAAKFLSEKKSGMEVPKLKFTAYLCMYAADGSIVNGWLASQTDVLSNDWCCLD